MHQTIARILLVVAVVALVLPSAPPALAGDPPCTTRGDNMTRNGSITDGGYATQYGTVANEWNPFVFAEEPPIYNLADNESANGDISGSSSQYIHADGTPFNGGIYQTISGTQPGTYYEFSVGWAAMLRDIGGGQNRKIDNVIIRMVGADPTGGTDPHSASVVWGPELQTGSSGQSLNSPKMRLVFAAQSDHVTVYVRAFNRGTGASDKIFLDVICLVPRGDLPTATPAATATPTPTETSAPKVKPAAAVPVATRAPTNTPIPTKTPTLVPTNTPTITNTPTVTPVPTDTPRPRRAIPLAGAAVDNNAGDSSESEEPTTNSAGIAVLIGSVGLIGVSGFGILCLGAVLAFRFLRRPSFY